MTTTFEELLELSRRPEVRDDSQQGFCSEEHSCPHCGRCIWLPCTTADGVHPEREGGAPGRPAVPGEPGGSLSAAA